MTRGIVAYRTDFPFRVLTFLTKRRPLATAVLYFVVSWGGLYLIIFGSAGFVNIWRTPRHLFIVDNINLGLLAPFGIALLCHLYATIESSFAYLGRGHVIPAGQLNAYEQLCGRLERAYNNRYVTLTAIVLAIGFSVYNYFLKRGCWLGVGGGLAAIYARIWITLNFYFILLILYKCMVTVWGIRKIMGLKIDVQPMHPDKCGGFRAIGQLALTIYYFVLIIMVLFALLVIFDPFAREQPLYLVLYLLFYLLGSWLAYVSIANVNRHMSSRKKEVLERLNLAFNKRYKRISEGGNDCPFRMEFANDIPALYNLYQIVNRMPVWPFDVASIVRYAIIYALPLTFFLLDALTNPESVVFRVIALLTNAQTS